MNCHIFFFLFKNCCIKRLPAFWCLLDKMKRKKSFTWRTESEMNHFSCDIQFKLRHSKIVPNSFRSTIMFITVLSRNCWKKTSIVFLCRSEYTVVIRKPMKCINGACFVCNMPIFSPSNKIFDWCQRTGVREHTLVNSHAYKFRSWTFFHEPRTCSEHFCLSFYRNECCQCNDAN